MTIERVLPFLPVAPGAAVIPIVDDFLDLTGPARAATIELHSARVTRLMREIRSIDPNYQYDSAGEVWTLEGQVNQINDLRFDKAAASYRIRHDTAGLQEEVHRFLQLRVDAAYERGVSLFRAGRLTPRLSENEAIGNYIDREVRNELRTRLHLAGIRYSSGDVRVVGRQYNTSGERTSYVVPDARVGNGVYDWTLEPKTLSKRQVRGFFDSDVRPDWTAVIRPSQLGPRHSYFIKTPRG